MTPAINKWNQIKTIFLRLFHTTFTSLREKGTACGRRSMLWENLLVNSSFYNTESIQSSREAQGCTIPGNHFIRFQWPVSDFLRVTNMFSSVPLLLHLLLDGVALLTFPWMPWRPLPRPSWPFCGHIASCSILDALWCLQFQWLVPYPSSQDLFYFSLCGLSLSISPSSKAPSTTHTCWFLNWHLVLSPEHRPVFSHGHLDILIKCLIYTTNAMCQN